jgi:hypothetical protein
MDVSFFQRRAVTRVRVANGAAGFRMRAKAERRARPGPLPPRRAAWARTCLHTSQLVVKGSCLCHFEHGGNK